MRGPLFSVKSVINRRRETYRAAVVVSRKVHKSAVVRNRIRRRIYEIIQSQEDLIDGPQDIIITVFHDSVVDLPHNQLEHFVKKQLKTAGVLGHNQPKA